MLDVVHVGFHRTATSWLQTDVFPQSRRHFFAVRHDPAIRLRLRSIVFDDDPAVIPVDEHPDGTVTSFERFSGDVWSGGHERARTARRLKSMLRDAGVIVAVRAQPAMLLSLYAQYVNEGGVVDFERFVGEGGDGLSFSLDHLDYAAFVEMYVDLFGRERVLVVPFELLRDGGFVERMAAFAGEPWRPDTAARNASPSASGVRAMRSFNRVAHRSPFNPSPPLPVGGRSVVRRLVQRRALRGPSMAEWCGGEAARVSRRYGDSNRQLQAMVPEDLGQWGYPL